MTLPRDVHVRRSAADYGVSLLNLFPQGIAWPRERTSVLYQLVNGIAAIFGYVDKRAADLLEIETDPRRTIEMLDEWETAFGLPDPCLIFPPSSDGRRLALLQKMTLLGEQDRNFFIALAKAQGLTIRINEYSPYQCGISRVGLNTTKYSDDGSYRWGLGHSELRFYWKVNIDNVLTGVECILRRYKPAHTEIIYTYTNVLDRAGSLYPWLGV